MAREQSPAFQFYPQDFLADDKVMAMNAAARGVYIVLLCHCWLNVELPNDPKIIRRLALYDGQHWPLVWGMVKTCFHVRDGRLIQPRIERERAKQARFREMKASAGSAGGKQKASNRLAESLAKASPPSSSSSSSSTNVKDHKESTVAARHGSNGNGHMKKPNLSVVTRLAHEVIKADPTAGFADQKEDLKTACAKLHIDYQSDPELIGKALESALAQRPVS